MVLAKVTYNCKECGLIYCFIIDVDNNELNERLETLKQKCSECKSIVDATVEHIKTPYITVEKNAIMLFGIHVMTLHGDEFDINLANLAEAGFCGNVNLNGYDNTTTVGINSIYKKIDKVVLQSKKPITKQARHNRPIPTLRTEPLRAEAPIPPIRFETVGREERDNNDPLTAFERELRDANRRDTLMTPRIRRVRQ